LEAADYGQNEIQAELKFSSASSKAGGAVFLSDVDATIDSNDNVYEYCFTNLGGGGALAVHNSGLDDADSSYMFTAAYKGGGIYFNGGTVGGTLTLTNPVFEQTQAQQGGGLYVEGISYVELVNADVTDVWAFTDGGFFYAAGGAGSTLDFDTGFTLAGCESENGCFHVSADMDVTQNIVDADLSDTTYPVTASDVSGGLWYFADDMSGTVILRYGKYEDLNAATEAGGFLTSAADSLDLTAEYLTIYCQTGVTFTLSDIQEQLEASAGSRAGAIYINDQSLDSTVLSN